MSPENAMTLVGPVQNSPKGHSRQTFRVFLVLIPDFLRCYYMDIISDSDGHTEHMEEQLRGKDQCTVTSSWLIRHSASDRGSIPEIRQYKTTC